MKYQVRRGECMDMTGADLNRRKVEMRKRFNGAGGVPNPQTWQDVYGHCANVLQKVDYGILRR